MDYMLVTPTALPRQRRYRLLKGRGIEEITLNLHSTLHVQCIHNVQPCLYICL